MTDIFFLHGWTSSAGNRRFQADISSLSP
jgi:hypothetical protein